MTPTDTTGAEPRPLQVSEYFGPTIQGEGPSTGQQALFIRLSRCNLACPACDTPYTWDWRRFDPRVESTPMTVPALRDWALSHPTRLIVITGGEPLLQQQRLAPLVTSLSRAGRRVEIETNGTRTPHHQLLADTTQFNVSPKLRGFNGIDLEEVRINSQALRAFASSRKAIFKFVVTTPDDIDEITHWQDVFKLDPVWVMSAGTTIESVLAGTTWLVEHAIQRNWHVSTRLHILLWGDQRGR